MMFGSNCGKQIVKTLEKLGIETTHHLVTKTWQALVTKMQDSEYLHVLFK